MPSMVLQIASTMRWFVCQALPGLSHLEETKMVGIALLEHASNKNTDDMSITSGDGRLESWVQSSYERWN